MEPINDVVKRENSFTQKNRLCLDDIIHSMKHGFYAADNEGNISFANQSFAEIFRYANKDEILGLNLADNLYESRKDRISFLKDLVENSYVSDYMIRMVRKDGSRVVISASSNLLKDKTGRVIGVEGILKEFPDKKETTENKTQEIHDLATHDEKMCKDLDLLIQDPLTGLYNYQYFLKCLDSEIKRTNRFFQPLCVMMIDVDNFQIINNRFGREAGDALLKKVGTILQKNFRDTDIICRQSQDQFVTILPVTTRDEVLEIAKIVKDAIQSESFEKTVTCSIGISRYILGMTTQELLLKANLGLYMAKEMGKNEACLYG